MQSERVPLESGLVRALVFEIQSCSSAESSTLLPIQIEIHFNSFNSERPHLNI